MSGKQHSSNGWKIARHIVAVLSVVLLSGFLASTSVWAIDEAATAAPATASVTENTAPAENVAPSGRVARAIFTTAIVDREPVDNLESLTNSTSQVYFFSDLRELAGQIVTHRWEHDGQTMDEITFKVGTGARWRVYSSKNLLPEWTGTWTVVVSNESGQTIQSTSLEYVAAPAAQ